MDSGGPKEACVTWGAHWHHLANTIEPSTCFVTVRAGTVCGVRAAFSRCAVKIVLRLAVSVIVVDMRTASFLFSKKALSRTCLQYLDAVGWASGRASGVMRR